QLLSGIRQLDPIESPGRHSICIQVQVTQLNVCKMGIRAPARARAIAADDGEGHETAPTATLQIAEPGGQRQFTLIGTEETPGPGSVSCDQPQRHYRGGHGRRSCHEMSPPTRYILQEADITAFAAARTCQIRVMQSCAAAQLRSPKVSSQCAG